MSSVAKVNILKFRPIFFLKNQAKDGLIGVWVGLADHDEGFSSLMA